jgi:RNA polymerase sigma-70 factor (ECF subfamily)
MGGGARRRASDPRPDGATTTGADGAPPAASPDADLVRAALAGEGRAFEVLARRHRGAAVAVSRRLLGGAPEAEDVAQEALLVALRRLDRLREPDRFGVWLRGIAARLSWRRRAAAGPVEDRADDRPLEEPGPGEVVEGTELRAELNRVVADLPPGQREAIRLVYLAGASYDQAAAALGVSAGAVKTRLHKARAALRQRLGLDQKARARPARATDLAVHEAGHAVMRWLAGLPVDRVTIVPPDADAPAAAPSSRDMAVELAGDAANDARSGRRPGGTRDRAIALGLASGAGLGEVDAVVLVAAQAARARERLARPDVRRLVQAVARELAERRTLTGREFAAVVAGAAR